MNEVCEYACRESAEAALDRIGATTQVAVWSSANLETRLEELRKEMTTLKVILGAWRLAEERRKAATAQDPIREQADVVDENHPLAKMYRESIMKETTQEIKPCALKSCTNCKLAHGCNDYEFDNPEAEAAKCPRFSPIEKGDAQ